MQCHDNWQLGQVLQSVHICRQLFIMETDKSIVMIFNIIISTCDNINITHL